MTIAVYICIYAGLATFVLGSIVRIITYAKNPIHLRWELYPIPHEDPKRAGHGGSRFEVSNFWTRPQPPNRIGELRAMVPEIAFLKSLREFNRGLWYASFLFHFGLYLTIATALLVMVAVEMPRIGGSVWLLHALYKLTGSAAVVMTLTGATALLIRRLADPELKNYTSPADLFNLHLFIVTYAVLAAGYLVRPENTASAGQLIRGLASFDAGLPIGRGFGGGLILGSALVAYIPFTHMAHFIAKYFTYHLVRWDDRVNVAGEKIELRVASYLAYRPTWSAAHIAGKGEKTWAELAAANPMAEVRK